MKPLSLLIFLLIIISSHAQQSFTKAVLYKGDGSKTDCYIKSTIYEGTQQMFEYAMEKGGKTSTIDAGGLNKVEFEDGMVLERHFIRITSMSTSILNRRLADYEAPDHQESNWFMIERVISGSYTLYQFIDKYSFSHFFYKTLQDTVIQQLEYKEYVDDNSSLINKREFRNQLLFLTATTVCEQKLSALIERIEYRLQHFISVFKKLNACAGEQSEVSNRYINPKPIIRFTVSGGITATRLSTTTPNPAFYPGLTKDAFSSSISPLFGASLEVVPRKRQKNYAASLDILFHSYAAKTDSLHPSSYQTAIGKIKFSAFSFSPVIRFKLTQKSVAPFIEAGASFRLLSKNGDEYYIRNSISGSETRMPIFTGKSNSFAFLAGAGVEFKRFSIHARYSFPSSKSSTYYSTIFFMGKFKLFGKDTK
jgi:hypothetical protein